MNRFSVVDKGYDIDEVNRFIDIVIARFEKLNTENVNYAKEIEDLKKELDKAKQTDDKMERAILAISDVSDKIKETSKKEASLIIDDAKNNANSIVHEALVKASEIEHESAVLENNVNVYKERIKSLLEALIKTLDDIDGVKP